MPTQGPRIDCKIVTKRYFVCPKCNQGEFQCEHLYHPPLKSDSIRSAGPWYCDNCGAGWRIYYSDHELYVNSWDTKVSRYVLLEIPPNERPIRLLLEHGFAGDWDEHQIAYLYEEHHCAINFLRDVIEVEHNGEIDPHGLVRHCATFTTEETAMAALRRIAEIETEMLTKGVNPQDQQ